MTVFKKAEDKIRAAKTGLVLDTPFFGSLLLKMQFVEDNSIPTLATDIYDSARKIMYNREFIESLPIKEVKGALVHEVLHVAMAHALRRDNRDYIKWNMAGDYAINIVICDAGLNLPSSDGFKPLLDMKYRGMSAEQIYSKLPNPEVIEVIFDPNAGGEGEGDGEDAQSKKGYVIARVEGHNGCTCGGMNDVKSEDGRELTDSEKSAIEAEIKSMVAEAATMAKAAGNMPGGLLQFVDSLLEAKVDWREQLRLFFERVTKNDYSWQYPNRRYMAQQIYLPSLYDHSIGTIVVARDTSGSVSDDISKQFASETSAMLETVNLEKLIDIQCDSHIQALNEFTKEDLPLDMQVKGRGGTYFRPVFDWIKENDIQPTCLVYLTDLYPADQYPDEPDYPVIWVAADANPKDPPFGEVIRIQ